MNFKCIIQPGDSLYDLFDIYWEKIYYHSANKELRKTAPDPSKIMPGQIIYVPHQFFRYPIVKKNTLDKSRQAQDYCDFTGFEKFKKATKHHNVDVSPVVEYQLRASINKEQNYFLYSTHTKNEKKSLRQLDGLELEFDGQNLFSKVVHKNQPCYWVAIEPFNFFLDIDDPHGLIDLSEVYENIYPLFDEFLLCSTDPITEEHYNEMSLRYDNYPLNRIGCSIFTKKKVTYKEAIEIELEIASLFSQTTSPVFNRFDSKIYSFPKGIVDPIFATMSPLAYKRSVYSVHGWYGDRRSKPRPNISKGITLSSLDMFLYSNPNS